MEMATRLMAAVSSGFEISLLFFLFIAYQFCKVQNSSPKRKNRRKVYLEKDQGTPFLRRKLVS